MIFLGLWCFPALGDKKEIGRKHKDAYFSSYSNTDSTFCSDFSWKSLLIDLRKDCSCTLDWTATWRSCSESKTISHLFFFIYGVLTGIGSYIMEKFCNLACHRKAGVIKKSLWREQFDAMCLQQYWFQVCDSWSPWGFSLVEKSQFLLVRKTKFNPWGQ